MFSWLCVNIFLCIQFGRSFLNVIFLLRCLDVMHLCAPHSFGFVGVLRFVRARCAFFVFSRLCILCVFVLNAFYVMNCLTGDFCIWFCDRDVIEFGVLVWWFGGVFCHINLHIAFLLFFGFVLSFCGLCFGVVSW